MYLELLPPATLCTEESEAGWGGSDINGGEGVPTRAQLHHLSAQVLSQQEIGAC